MSKIINSNTRSAARRTTLTDTEANRTYALELSDTSLSLIETIRKQNAALNAQPNPRRAMKEQTQTKENN